MQTIGERLLEARQRRGVSIREAAESTKVRGDYLAAMENNQFDSIQLADVYRRGFLKIYAKFLRLDADRVVNDYNALLAARNPGPLKSRRSTDHELPRSIEMREPEGLDEFSSGAIEVAARPDNRPKLLLVGGCISFAIILSLVLYKALASDSSEKKEAAEQSSAQAVPTTGEIAVFGNTAPVTISLYKVTRRDPYTTESTPLLTRSVTPGVTTKFAAIGDVELRSTGKISFNVNGGEKSDFANGGLRALLSVPAKR